MTVRVGDVYLDMQRDDDRKVIVAQIDRSKRRFAVPHALIRPHGYKGRSVWIRVSSLTDPKKWMLWNHTEGYKP